jgi:cell division transport system permease protein
LLRHSGYFAGDPTTLSLLSIETIPSQFKVVPKTTDPELVRSLANQYRTLPGVAGVSLAEDEFDVISTLSGFVRTVTIGMSLVLLAVAVILIWNTIRTAIFARRREIEVMKLVGATDWFIRVPFILEGLIQGLAGALVSCAGLWGLNSAWTSGVAGFKSGTGVSALVVPGSYVNGVMISLLVIGAVAGAVGSAVASNKFLDV